MLTLVEREVVVSLDDYREARKPRLDPPFDFDAQPPEAS